MNCKKSSFAARKCTVDDDFLFVGDTNIFTNADCRRIKREINDEKRERRDYEITPFSDFLKAP